MSTPLRSSSSGCPGILSVFFHLRFESIANPSAGHKPPPRHEMRPQQTGCDVLRIGWPNESARLDDQKAAITRCNPQAGYIGTVTRRTGYVSTVIRRTGYVSTVTQEWVTHAKTEKSDTAVSTARNPAIPETPVPASGTMTAATKLWVDADACPGAVRDIPTKPAILGAHDSSLQTH